MGSGPAEPRRVGGAISCDRCQAGTVPYFTSYDGTKLWYETRGEGAPLVCLPGGPGVDGRALGDLGGLTGHRTLVILDARAAGRSEIPADQASCAFSEQAHDVESLRRHLGLARPDLLAHSASTLTAQAYAARYGAVGRLVLVTPAGRVAREPDEAEVAAIKAAGAATAVPADDYSAPPPWYRQTFYSGTPARSQAAEPLARLAAVTAPVLALAGAADDVAGTVPARLIGECYPKAEVVVLPGCGHYPWLDDPATFRTRVAGFLDRIS
jgi:pimeloyl-ACP methyl ester carboxylesterase